MVNNNWNKPTGKKVNHLVERNDLMQFQIVSAIYSPKDEKDLSIEAKEMIGKRFDWRAGWVMSKKEKYPGQWAMILQKRAPVPFAWRPEQDLKDIKK